MLILWRELFCEVDSWRAKVVEKTTKSCEVAAWSVPLKSKSGGLMPTGVPASWAGASPANPGLIPRRHLTVSSSEATRIAGAARYREFAEAPLQGVDLTRAYSSSGVKITTARKLIHPPVLGSSSTWTIRDLSESYDMCQIYHKPSCFPHVSPASVLHFSFQSPFTFQIFFLV